VDQVKVLFTALWSNGIPFLYWDGSYESLPSTSYNSIRFLFLDIELENKGNTVKGMSSSLAARIKRIVGDNPPPYFIVFWTQNSDSIQTVINYLKQDNIAPISYTDFEKPVFWKEPNLAPLKEKIRDELGKLGAFQYIVDWENLLEKSCNEFTTDFFSLIHTGEGYEQWSTQTASILGNLGCAYSGNETLTNNKEEVKDAFLMLEQNFLYTVEKNIKNNTIDEYYTLNKETLGIELLSKLNTKLVFDFNPSPKPMLGSLFLDDDNIYLSALKKLIFNERPVPEETCLCAMIMTPSCDLARDKKYLLKKSDDGKTSINYRILYGLLIPVDSEDIYKGVKKHSNSPQFFLINPFWHEKRSKTYTIAFLFGGLTSKWFRDDNMPKFEMAIKRPLAFDIQANMANHAGRLGNYMLSLPE
jgi:hypothetical protein